MRLLLRRIALLRRLLLRVALLWLLLLRIALLRLLLLRVALLRLLLLRVALLLLLRIALLRLLLLRIARLLLRIPALRAGYAGLGAGHSHLARSHARLNEREQPHPLRATLRAAIRLGRSLDLEPTIGTTEQFHIRMPLMTPLFDGDGGLCIDPAVVPENDPAKDLRDFDAAFGGGMAAGIEAFAGIYQFDLVADTRLVTRVL